MCINVWGSSHRPECHPHVSAVDFLLLLAASLQWQVFVDENQMWMRMQAGDNVEISRDLQPEDIAQLSPVPNFIFCRYKRTPLPS